MTPYYGSNVAVEMPKLMPKGKKGMDPMKKLVMSAVAMVSMAAFAANETDMDEEFSAALFSSVKSINESFGTGGFSAQKPEAYEGAPMVVPIGYLVKPALPTNVPSSIAPNVFGSVEFGQKKRRNSFSIMYAIFAKGLVDFDPNDVVVDSITTAKGKDLSKLKNGNSAWEVENRAVGVTLFRDQGYATFSLKCAGKVMGAPMPTVKGKVSFSVADKVVDREFAGKISAGSIGEGELVWKVKKGKSMWGGSGQQLVVSPYGGKAQDATFEVFAGGKKLDGAGNMSMGRKVEFYFKLPSTDEIVVKAKCPEGVKTVTLDL